MKRSFNTIKRFILMLLVGFVFTSCTDYSSLSRRTIEIGFTDEGWEMYNDLLDGDYQICDTKLNYCAYIWGYYDEGDSQANKPYIQFTTGVDSDVIEGARLSIHHIEDGIVYQGYKPVYFTSTIDPASRIDCKDYDAETGTLWFFKEKSIEPTKTNPCQSFYVERRVVDDEITYYRFFLVKNDKRYYFYNFEDSKLKLIRQDLIKSDANRCYFRLKPLAGDYSLSSELVVCDTNSYAFDFYNNYTVVDRIANSRKSMPLVTDAPFYGKPLTFGINGYQDKGLRAYYSEDGYKTFAIPYDIDQFTLSYDFNYKYSWKRDSNLIWKKDMPLRASSDGKEYFLDYADAETLSDITLDGHPIGVGTYGLLKYNNSYFSFVDNASVQFLDRFDSFYHGELSQNWSSLVGGEKTLFRTYFAYRVKDSSGAHKDIMLMSEPFYLYYYGVSEEEFLPLKVTQLDTGAAIQEEGFEIDNNYSDYATLLPNSLVLGGFKAEPLIKGYDVSITNYGPNDNSMPSTSYIYGNYSLEFNENGRYFIDVKDKYDSHSKSGNIFVAEDFASFFFGKVYGTKQSEYSIYDPCFVNGNRILSGDLASTYVPDNMVYAYRNYHAPTYSGDKVTLRAKKFLDYASSLSIKIEKEGQEEWEVIEDTTSNIFNSDYVINEAGHYFVTIETTFNTQSGYNPILTVEFYLVNEAQKPFVNSALFAHSRYVTDYIRDVYYIDTGEVTVDCYQKILGISISKTKTIHHYYVTHLYEDALGFALSQERVQTHKNDDGTYTYHGESYDNEYELFAALHTKARQSITKGVFEYNYREYDSWAFSSGHVRGKDNEKFLYDKAPNRIISILEDGINNSIHKQLINSFSFSKDIEGIVSNRVLVYTVNVWSDGSKHAGDLVTTMPYNVTVNEHFEANNIPTGYYLFKETNIHGEWTYIYAYYIARNSKCDAVINMTLKDRSKATYDYANNGETLTISRGTRIDNIVNPYDQYSLVVITDPANNSIITNTTDFETTIVNRLGTYKVLVRDRVGNEYKINFEVVA